MGSKGKSGLVFFLCTVILGPLANADWATSERPSLQAVPTSDLHADGYVGNGPCAKCHSEIYDSYMRTAMAQSSGPAEENLISGEFTHKRSGVHYSIYREAGTVWLSFDRPGDSLVNGRRQLLYFIGQGRRGRTYLFSVDGCVFESPINWYTGRQVWDMAPAYGEAKEIPLDLPATTGCLDCHVSGVRAPLGGSENCYPVPVFLYSGVTCERCHGPGAAHLTGGPIVNPAKLPPSLGDQVCMQCHLEGNAAIERPGKHLYEYKPGENLFDFIRYFVLAGNVPQGLRATGQFEALAQSVCKLKSGDAMSCISCHNPHQAITSENRVDFYRAKCIACHGATLAANHHSKQPDCTSCHMPAPSSSDVAHTQVTDHRIPRRPLLNNNSETLSSALPALVPFPPSNDASQSLRELALAWQSIVNSGMTMAQPHAEHLLHAALARSPDDPTLLTALAFAAQKRGDNNQARTSYEKALAHDPALVDAAANLGVIEAKQRHLAEAVKLWQSAFRRAPGKSEIGMNLALVFCQSGKFDVARNYVLRVLQFNPDFGSAKKLLGKLNADAPSCSL